MADEPAWDSLDALLSLSGPIDCVDPEEVDQEEVLLHARGELSSASVSAHLEQCVFCQRLALEYREIRVPKRLGLRWLGVVGGVAAAAACVGLLVVGPRDEAGIVYEIASISGAVQSERSQDEQDHRVRFASTSMVEITIRPAPTAEGPGGQPDLKAAVFLVGGDESLAEVKEAQVTSYDDGAFRSFAIRGLGRVLFGDKPGPRRLVVGVFSDETLSDGLRLSEATRLEGISLVIIDAEYLGGLPSGP